MGINPNGSILLDDNFVNCCMSYSEKDNEKNASDFEMNEQDAGYEKAELDLIRRALKRSHTERFEMMVRMIKIGIMLKSAKVTHQKDPLSE